jgi:hypothetical protein
MADEGESLEVGGTVFVTNDPGWPQGWRVVGYEGLLARIRSAFDPQQNYFYFGPA